MSDPLDKRLHAYRDDLADVRLRNRVAAERYAEGRPARVASAVEPLRRQPRPDAAQDTEALHGEAVLVFETTEEGWVWVQLVSDGYVGWMASAALGPPSRPATHRVGVPRTLVFPGPDIKLPPLGALPMGALVEATGEAADGNATYILTSPAGAIVRQHLLPVDLDLLDFVAVAEGMLGAPYLWGGKTSLGIDCSGLVQIALEMAGRAAPRDADLQERALGTRLAGIEALKRGDLVFWKGHVGIMLDGSRLLHANAFHMMTAIEPLEQAVARIEARGLAVTSIRRLGAVAA